MGGKAKAPAPDPNIGIAQKELSSIAQQQLDFAQKQYIAEQPRLQRYADLAEQFVQSQVQSQQTQDELAASYQQRLQGTFYPIEDTLAFDALGYYDASPEAQAKIEQAYLKQNQGLVDQRYADKEAGLRTAFEQEKARYDARQNYMAQGGGELDAEIDRLQAKITQGTADVAEIERFNAAQQKKKKKGGLIGGALGGLPGYFVGKSVSGAKSARSTAEIKAEIEAAKKELTGVERDQKVKALEQEAFESEYADFSIDPETGLSFAEGALNKQLQGLQTQKAQDSSNVGSTLDTVRAYSEAYKSGQEQQAGRARQDVAQQFDQRGLQLQRQLASFGVDPTSGRFASQMNSNNVMQAASEAQAMNQARQAAKQLGWAKRMDAVSLGRGLPGSQATSVGQALQAGQAGLSGQSSISGMYQNAGSQFMSGLGQAGSSFGQLGNLGIQNSQLQQNAVNMNNQASGALTGALIGGLSQAGAAYLGK